MIEKKKAMANGKVVKKAKKGILLDLDDFISIPRDRKYFTTLQSSQMYDLLSDLQKQVFGKPIICILKRHYENNNT